MPLTDSSPLEIARSASIASRSLAVLPTEARNNALTAIHQALANARASILTANAKDLDLATTAAENGELSQSVLKRLDLGRKGKFEDMLQGILDVRDLEDPCKSLVRTRSARADSHGGCRGALHHSKSASSASYAASRRYVDTGATTSTLWCMAFRNAAPIQ